MERKVLLSFIIREVSSFSRFFRAEIILSLLFLAALASIALCSCSSCRMTTVSRAPEPTVSTASSIDVRHETVVSIDTVFQSLPSQSSERVTKDTTSVLETEYAISSASVSRDGTLRHTLDTKPTPVRVTVPITLHQRDSIVVRDSTNYIYIPVKQALTVWQTMCVRWFPPLAIVLLIVCMYAIRRWYRLR